MKDIFLSVVVICALVAAGIGGTLADFSDSEEEIGDTLQAGSLDLKVNGTDDPNVQPFIFRGIIPDKIVDVTKTVKNVGTIDGWLYIHIKNAITTETDDKGFKPEPEVVAEDGGKVGQKMVAGIGSDNGTDMWKHVEIVLIKFGPSAGNMTSVDLSAYDTNNDGKVKFEEIVCNQMLLGQLPACGEEYEVNFQFMLQDVDESYYGFDYFDVGNEHEIKWNWWPTNAMMGDTTTFDILFELLQTDYVPPGGG